MKESYVEGIANHDGPESCARVREGRVEALTGGSMGWVLSRETTPRRESVGTDRGAEVVWPHRRQHGALRHGKRRTDPARSETPRTCGRILLGTGRSCEPTAAAWEGIAAELIVKPEGVRR